LQYLFEKSAYSRRFEKKSVITRQKKLKYKRNAKKYNEEINSNRLDKKAK
jgi:hypothetical protein